MQNTTVKSTIAIIGAGLAGLTAGYRLFQKGYSVEVYEARNRVGGRVLSALVKNYQGDFSEVELGGQNIADGGEATNFLGLCTELGLTIDTKETTLDSLIHYQGQYFDFQEQLSHFLSTQPNAMEVIDSLASQCTSIEDLIKRFFVSSELLQYTFSTFMTAYEGINVKYQSIYHNLDTLKCMIQGGLSKSQGIYQTEFNVITSKIIQGGNALLPIKMAEVLESHLHLNKVLQKIEKIENQFKLTFQDEFTVTFDHVILAIPASTYQDIALSDNILDQERWKTMQSLDYGSNYKILCPFNLNKKISHRTIISEAQVSFFNQDQTIAILFINRPMTAVEIHHKFDIVCRGYHLDDTLESYTTQIAIDQQHYSYTTPVTHTWFDDPYAKGSYSSYSTILSSELDDKIMVQGEEFKTLFKPTENGLFFIGEHTTLLEFVGTMEAAIESGERLARLYR